MISRENFLSLNFVKKEDFTGSFKGMRFLLRMEKEEDEARLRVFIWSEPFCFEATPDEDKMSKAFRFSEDGLSDAIEWMNENYDAIISMK